MLSCSFSAEPLIANKDPNHEFVVESSSITSGTDTTDPEKDMKLGKNIQYFFSYINNFIL